MAAGFAPARGQTAPRSTSRSCRTRAWPRHTPVRANCRRAGGGPRRHRARHRMRRRRRGRQQRRRRRQLPSPHRGRGGGGEGAAAGALQLWPGYCGTAGLSSRGYSQRPSATAGQASRATFAFVIQERGQGGRAARRVEGLAPAAGAGLSDKRWQLRKPPGGAHEVDHGGAPAHGWAVLLRHAAQEAHHEMRLAALTGGELADVREHAVLGVLADRAGNQEQNVGGLGVGDDRGAAGAQNFGDQLGVELVHLAAVRRDVDARAIHKRGRL